MKFSFIVNITYLPYAEASNVSARPISRRHLTDGLVDELNIGMALSCSSPDVMLSDSYGGLCLPGPAFPPYLAQLLQLISSSWSTGVLPIASGI